MGARFSAPWVLSPLRARHPKGANPTHPGGHSHGLQGRFPRRSAPGVNPTRPRGHSHAIQRRFPRRSAPGVNPTRAPGAIPTGGDPRDQSHALQGRFPRSSESIPTVGQPQRQIPQGRFKKPQVRMGVRFPHRGICLRCGPGTQKGRIPRAPGVIPTVSRGISHGGRLQGSIPRVQEVIPTQSRGDSHGGRLQGSIPRPETIPTQPKLLQR